MSAAAGFFQRQQSPPPVDWNPDLTPAPLGVISKTLTPHVRLAESPRMTVTLVQIRDGTGSLDLTLFLRSAGGPAAKPGKGWAAWTDLEDAEFHLGVELHDGRTAANTDGIHWLNQPGVQRSERGIQIAYVGGSGGSQGWTGLFQIDGISLSDIRELLIEWPAQDLPETRRPAGIALGPQPS